ncbi:MAG: glycosyltransferase family 39 protein [Rudaea sp.]
MNAALKDWRLLWLLLMLPVALFLPAVPIDETRYLTVAWEMRASGNYLLPHLNGDVYTHKGPLLFWLINIGWLVAGLHVWVVRVGILMASLASLVLFERLARRLGAGEETAHRATVLLAGMTLFALFSTLIMFDVVLTTCVLVVLHGVVDCDARRWRRGIVLIALGSAAGLLVKGPVVLLDACLPALLAPCWSDTARRAASRWYLALLLGIVGGVAIALGWALLAGGTTFIETVLLHQTAERISQSFAHARPFWWYFMVLPFLVLPWTLSLRAPARAWVSALRADRVARFGLVLFLPALIAFCFFSGKQPHYLLPLLPGLALYLASVMRDAQARVRGRLFGALLLCAGVFLAAMPYLAEHAATLPGLDKLVRDGGFSASEQRVMSGLWPLWGAILVAIGAFLLAHPRAHAAPRALALANVAAIVAGMLAIAQAVGPTLDVGPTAQHIRAMQDAGKPIVHLGWHHGLFGFPGRLEKPLPRVDMAGLYDWCAAHPDGEVVTFYTKYGIATKPEQEIPYRLGRILIWRAADLSAGPKPKPSTKPDEEDAPEE